MNDKMLQTLKKLLYGPRSLPPLVWRLTVLAAVLRIALMLSTRFTSEDFLITLRYADNLAHGRGLVFNPHQWVLGTTTPLYTLILAAFAWLKLPAPILGKLLNIAADSLLCPLLYRWALALGGDRKTGLTAAFLACICPLQMNWAVSGMETGLVTLGGTLLWVLALEGETALWPIAAAVVVLIRWDALLIVFLVLLQLWRNTGKMPVRQALITLAILAPFLLAAWHWYGTPLPGTAFAKSTVYGWRADHLANPILRRFPQIPRLVQVFFGFPYGAPFTIAGILGVYSLLCKKSYDVLWPLAWLMVYWGSFVISRILLFTWYLVPPLPVLYLLGSFGISFVHNGIKNSAASLAKAAPAFAVLLTLACFGYSCRVLYLDQKVEDAVRKPMGLWLRSHAQKGDVVMLEPIGYVGYYSGMKVLDVIGLVSPQVLRYYNSKSVYPPYDIAMAYQPTWCILRPGELDHVKAAANAQGVRWSAYYHLAHTFELTPTSYIYYIFKKNAPPTKHASL